MKPRARLCYLLAAPADVELDWWKQADIWRTASKEGMSALIWQLYRHQDDVSQKEAVQDAMLTDIRYLKADYMRHKLVLGQVLEALNEEGIPVICMRGKAVAESLYDPSFVRSSTDIDLLYHERDSLVVKQTLGDKLGFKPSVKFSDMFLRDRIPLDLHIEPLGIDRIRAWEHLTPLRAPDFFTHSIKGELAGAPALLVHPRVNLPYLCFHALKHSFERLIWLYDIALLSNQITADNLWDEVLDGIREYKLERPCYYALSYAKAHLGGEVPDTLLHAIQPNMGFLERRLFKRHMQHEVILFLAERLFAIMQPSFKHRLEFWRETIYPRYEIRKQIGGCGCVKCNFIRIRLKQVSRALWTYIKEVFIPQRT